MMKVCSYMLSPDNRFYYCTLQLFSIECRKTKTKVITLADRNRCKLHNEPIRIGSKYM